MVILNWIRMQIQQFWALISIVLSYAGKECEVSPYSSEYEAVWNIPVVTAATVWMNPMDGTAYLLVFHESLFVEFWGLPP